MATENLGKLISFKAGADLSAKQFYPVKLTGDNTIDVAGDTDVIIGILQDAGVVAGAAAKVCVNGISKFASNDTLVAGNVIMPGTSGAVTATTGKSVIGIVTESASANEIGSVLLASAGVKV